jgi:ABC-2 type transport system ATP-binding protein
MANLLELRGIQKTFGAFALQGVALDVPSGTITGLVGANGAGKSTLIMVILGLVAPDAGSLRLFGAPVRRGEAGPRARIGFVQECPALYPHLRVPELGRLVAPFYPAWDEAAFRRLCSTFELPLKTAFKDLSQGARSKTALALALSHGAELLVLDEPTSGLDPLARREVLDLLLDVIQDEGRAVLFSTHITSDLDRVADHVAIMKEGRVTLAGAKDDLMASWVLVKGGEDLLAGPLLARCRGGQRTDLGVVLLCEEDGTLGGVAGPNVLLERPSLEDLVTYHGRPLEVPCSL